MAGIPVTISATLRFTPDNVADLQALYELAVERTEPGGTVTKDDQAGHVVVDIAQQTTVE